MIYRKPHFGGWGAVPQCPLDVLPGLGRAGRQQGTYPHLSPSLQPFEISPPARFSSTPPDPRECLLLEHAVWRCSVPRLHSGSTRGAPRRQGPPWRGDGWTCALRDAEEERAASSQTPRKASRVTPPLPCDTRALPSSVTLAEKPPRFPYLRCGGWHPSRTAFGKVFYRP